MKSEWLPDTILRAASLVAPGDQRAEWMKGWRSELWYIPRRDATLFCLGAFQDALWLRRNNPNPQKWRGINLESPLRCLAFLGLLAAVSLLIAVRLPGAQLRPGSVNLRGRDFVDGCMGMLALSGVLLAAVRVAMGRTARDPHPVLWTARLRLGIFLALKIVLIQPILFGALVVVSTLPIAPLGLGIFWALPCRWVLLDQQRRCPVCLRLLTDPVRIGTPSQTFLEWYGAESTCSRGHGLLHSAEISASYSGEAEWLGLDDSWKPLFSAASRGR